MLIDLVKSVLSKLLDKHAPIRTCTAAERNTVSWMTDAILEAKRVRRQNERRWRSSGLTVHIQQYRFSCQHVKRLIRKAKSEYYLKQIEEYEGDKKKLLKKIIDKLLGRGKATSLPQYCDQITMATNFNEFFISKITTIRTSLASLTTSTDKINCPLNTVLVTPTTKLTHFEPTTSLSQKKIIIVKKCFQSHVSLRSPTHWPPP